MNSFYILTYSLFLFHSVEEINNDDETLSRMYSMSFAISTSISDRIGRPKYCLPSNLNNTTIFFYI